MTNTSTVEVSLAFILASIFTIPYAGRVLEWLRFRRTTKETPVHQRHGQLGEQAAKRFLLKAGLRFLVANYRTPHGEIDLVFKDRDCIAFVEVKTRTAGGWTRPAAAVNRGKKQRLSRSALHFMRYIGRPAVAIRFDIIEVLLTSGRVIELRHLPDAFSLSEPYRYH